jgi:hypothetical protein
MKRIGTVTVDTPVSFVGYSSLNLLEFTDLYLVASLRSSSSVTTEPVMVYLNGDGSAVYAGRALFGNGSSASSSTFNPFGGNAGSIAPGSSATSNTFGSLSIYFPNFKSSTTKSFSVNGVSENNASSANQIMVANTYTTTSPISGLSLNNLTGNWVAGSTVSLYGIQRGSGGATVS